MKNLRLSVKVGILVAVLVVTAGTIATVGVRQLAMLNAELGSLVDTTAKEMLHAAAARVELLSADLTGVRTEHYTNRKRRSSPYETRPTSWNGAQNFG